MSFAAAICSMVSDGIVPMSVGFFARLVWEAMSNLRSAWSLSKYEKIIADLRLGLLFGGNGDGSSTGRYSQGRHSRGPPPRRSFTFAPDISPSSRKGSRKRRGVGHHF